MKTYRVVWIWRGIRTVRLTGLTRFIADAMAEGLNNLAAQYNQEDKYVVEEEE